VLHTQYVGDVHGFSVVQTAVEREDGACIRSGSIVIPSHGGPEGYCVRTSVFNQGSVGTID
jgi:hypothetical protein